MLEKYTTELSYVRKGIAFFSVTWSPFILMDRYLIHGVVPSDGGIFQIFQKKENRLDLIMVERAFYGGLRNRIRELIDPLYMGFNPYRKEIEHGECYVRFSLVGGQDDMDDLVYFFTGSGATGRYKDIEVEEIENFNIRR